MKVTSKVRLLLRFQSGVFLISFVVLMAVFAWLSQQYHWTIDLTASDRNSLSSPTVRLLDEIQQPLSIRLFVSPVNENKTVLERLFQTYADQQPLIRFESLNPDLYPDLLREYDIRFDGEVLIEFEGRHEKTQQITETAITNVIQRLMRQGERWLVFLQGHGEADPYSEANHDLALFAERLAGQGFQIESLILSQTASIPENTDVLIIANPQTELLPGEVDLIQQYIEDGGNLLWLADPKQARGEIDRLNDIFTVEFLPGIIVDPNSQLFGLDRVDFALVADYPRHPVSQGIDSLSLFPAAFAIEFFAPDSFWEEKKLLVTNAESWNETGPMQGEIYRGDNEDEINGPLTIGITLAASHQDNEGKLSEQRVSIVGDADFLSNAYLGNGANLDIGLNLLNWLSHDDSLISISPKPAPDIELELSQNQQIAMAAGFGLLLPLLLLLNAVRLWYRRRHL